MRTGLGTAATVTCIEQKGVPHEHRFFLIIFGVYSAIARNDAPHHMSKLAPMKQKGGKTKGLVLHLFAYTILPLVTGGLMVWRSM